MRRAGCIAAVTVTLLMAPIMLPRPGNTPSSFPVLSGAARAVQPDEVLGDAALERRARAISAGLRCLVCQNQSIDDSDADLAKDLRVLVRERLAAGDSDETVVAFIVARYGEFVLLRPRFSTETAVLWGTPLALLLLGGAFAVVSARRRRREPAPRLTADEEAAVERALADNGL